MATRAVTQRAFVGCGGIVMRDGDFEVLSAGDMRAKYQLTAENRQRVKLDPANVPAGLRPLIPLAEQFGVGDDLIRCDIVAKTAIVEVEAMRQIVKKHEDALEEWLAGPEASGATFSDEYLAFSCLQMAADGC
jgi:hypothetical protein